MAAPLKPALLFLNNSPLIRNPSSDTEHGGVAELADWPQASISHKFVAELQTKEIAVLKSIHFIMIGCVFMSNTANGNDEAAQGLPADYAKNDALQKQPGDEHKRLANRVGHWKVTTKYAAAFGGQEEVGTCTMKLIMGGRFLISEGQTPMMGTPIETLGIFGFDTLSKEYSVTNFNSMYTSTYPMTGKLRKDGVIEYHGIMKDAMSPAGRTYRAEEKDINDNKFEIAVFDGSDAKEFQVMTMTYDRDMSK